MSGTANPDPTGGQPIDMAQVAALIQGLVSRMDRIEQNQAAGPQPAPGPAPGGNITMTQEEFQRALAGAANQGRQQQPQPQQPQRPLPAAITNDPTFLWSEVISKGADHIEALLKSDKSKEEPWHRLVGGVEAANRASLSTATKAEDYIERSWAGNIYTPAMFLGGVGGLAFLGKLAYDAWK